MIPLLLSLLLGCAPPEVAPSNPNASVSDTLIVVIGCTMRADRIGVYGNSRNTTPYLDQLANQGVRFEKVISNAPWTRPSIAAMVTGIHPRKLGVDGDRANGSLGRGIAEEVDTLAERMKGAGWSTVGVTANPNANSVVGFAQGFDSYTDTKKGWSKRVEQTIEGKDVVATFAQEAAKVQGKLFGFLVIIDTHRPIGAIPFSRLRLGLSPFSRSLVNDFDAALTRVDDALIQLDESLAAQGRSDRTLVFIGDHGEGLRKPRHAGPNHARRIYTSNLRIPWILHGQGVAAGNVVSGLTQSIDLFPTLMDLLGLPHNAMEHGNSQIEAVKGQRATTTTSEVFSVTRFGNVDRARITTPDWTYIHNYVSDGKHNRGKEELYEGSDRNELKNVAHRNAAILSALGRRAEELRVTMETDSIIWESSASSEELEQLRALGYIEEAEEMTLEEGDEG
jgi:arylsulfatase A-like enzyme